METITKQQLILVCLLVSIVTAVATSVATVSLNDANTGTDRTIYQVIERSIEKVADIPTVKNIVGTPEVKTPTVTELSPADIADKKSDSLVRIYEKIGETKKFIALGLAIGTKNAILASALPDTILPEHLFIAVTSDGREIPLKFEKSGLSNNFGVFTIQYAQGEKNKIPTLVLKDISSVKLGGNVVALGGKESGDVVSTGIVTEIKSIDDTATTKNILVTDMLLTTSISGWLLFDTSGNLVAFEKGLSDTEKTPMFVNAKVVAGEVKDYL